MPTLPDFSIYNTTEALDEYGFPQTISANPDYHWSNQTGRESFGVALHQGMTFNFDVSDIIEIGSDPNDATILYKYQRVTNFTQGGVAKTRTIKGGILHGKEFVVQWVQTDTTVEDASGGGA